MRFRFERLKCLGRITSSITIERAFSHSQDPKRAMQGDFDETVASGLASMYPAFDWSVVLRAHHGYQRACVLISGQASTDHLGHQVSHAPGRPNLHLFLILSQTLAGNELLANATRLEACWPRRRDCEPARSMRCVRACWRARWQARCGAAASWPPRSNA